MNIWVALFAVVVYNWLPLLGITVLVALLCFIIRWALRSASQAAGHVSHDDAGD
ncbi:hypothetical protein [Micromonospora sp. NPDC005305]|uniref:hypothetical protein n=1 Tax=Micromonospora sp. NPDC005305 TaxID=3156875 RepID=UPI0033A9FABD